MVDRTEVLTSALRTLNADRTASLAQIASDAGISRATLHRHIESRDALLHELCAWSLDRWEASLDAADAEAVGSSGDPDRIAAAIRALVIEYVEDADAFGFILTEPEIEADDLLLARSNALVERESSFFAAAQRAGVLRSDLPARWISWQMFGLLVASRDALRAGDVAVRTLPDLVLDTFLKGSGS